MATFYDEHLGTTLAREARYVPLFEAALALVPAGASVVELGCGAGRFAQLLLASGRASGYLGLDFSLAAVEEARRYTGVDVFRHADLRKARIRRAECYVALEVLEHLDDDLGLLGKLATGSRIVLSVPSFDSAGHVRHFPEPGSAAERYGEAIEITHEQRVDLPPTIRYPAPFFHLIAGMLR